MKEPELGKNEIQITSQHRIAFDAKNITLRNRFIKKSGRGDEAVDVVDYDRGLHYGTLESLGSRFVDREFLEGLASQVDIEAKEVKEVIDESIKRLESLKEEIISALKEGIVIDTGKKEKDSDGNQKGNS